MVQGFLNAFEIIKQKVYQSPVLGLPSFDKVFNGECDASRVDIGVVLVQAQKSLVYFSKKLTG